MTTHRPDTRSMDRKAPMRRKIATPHDEAAQAFRVLMRAYDRAAARLGEATARAALTEVADYLGREAGEP